MFLCIVLACFFIYFQVRRLRNGGCAGEEGGRQYVIVPSGEHPRILENGHATQARKGEKYPQYFNESALRKKELTMILHRKTERSGKKELEFQKGRF